VEVGTAGHGWLSHLSHIYKDACGLAQAKGLPSLICHEPAIEVKFMRGAAGTTRILTIRVRAVASSGGAPTLEALHIWCREDRPGDYGVKRLVRRVLRSTLEPLRARRAR
jgi:hypothetical protein